jgi:hypothetical protein
MPDQIEQQTGKIPLKDFLADFRSDLTDKELREKYNLPARAFVSLIKALLARRLVTPDDLAWRKRMAEQRDMAKESKFLSGLFICPNCSHPHPQPFDRCPACGANPSDFQPTWDGGESAVPKTGEFIEVEAEEMELTEDTEVVEDSEEIEETPEPKPQDEKTSAMKSVRSFLSKFKKK